MLRNLKKPEFVDKLAECNRGIKMAVTVLKNISQDEINWYHETRYWMHVSDEKTMINVAERRGIANGIQQVARNAIKEGLPTEQIAKLTGLTVDEINKLK